MIVRPLFILHPASGLPTCNWYAVRQVFILRGLEYALPYVSKKESEDQIECPVQFESESYHNHRVEEWLATVRKNSLKPFIYEQGIGLIQWDLLGIPTKY